IFGIGITPVTYVIGNTAVRSVLGSLQVVGCPVAICVAVFVDSGNAIVVIVIVEVVGQVIAIGVPRVVCAIVTVGIGVLERRRNTIVVVVNIESVRDSVVVAVGRWLVQVGGGLFLPVEHAVFIRVDVVNQRSNHALAAVDQSVTIGVIVATQDVELDVGALFRSEHPRIDVRVLTRTIVDRSHDHGTAPSMRSIHAVGCRPRRGGR